MTATPPHDNTEGPLPSPVRRFPEGATLSVAAVFGAAIVLASLIVGLPALDRLTSSDEVAAEDETTTTTGGTSTTTPDDEADEPAEDEETVPPTTDPEGEESTGDPEGEEESSTACPEGTDPVICDAAAFVEQVRGRSFKTFPTVTLLTDAELDAELAAELDAVQNEIATDGVVLQALGLLDPDQSYVEVFRSLLAVGVVGFYDPADGRLVVQGTELDLYAQAVLVHELTHAFDDQWFDIARDHSDDEEAYGFTAVVEGNASRVDQLWVASLDPEERAAYAQQEREAISDADLAIFASLPEVARLLQASPYVDGLTYVADLAAAGGEDAVDEALTTPPTSSEEILHPGLDRLDDLEIVVPVPSIDAGVEPLENGRLGELVVRQWLGRVAADGWGGDRYVSWLAGSASCIRVDLITDSAADQQDLAAAVEAWVAVDPTRRGAEPVQTEAGALLRVTGCSA
ncbi:MAG: hypothetical protein AAGA59_07195 [Actinomycetota bacterium]